MLLPPALRCSRPQSVSPILVSNVDPLRLDPDVPNPPPTYPWGTGAAPVDRDGHAVTLQRAYILAFYASVGTPLTAAGATVEGNFNAIIIHPNGGVIGLYTAKITATPAGLNGDGNFVPANFATEMVFTPGPKFDNGVGSGKWSGYKVITNTTRSNTSGNDLGGGDIAGPFIRGLNVLSAAYKVGLPVNSLITWNWTCNQSMRSPLLEVYYSQASLPASLVAAPHYAPWRVHVESSVSVEQYDVFWRQETPGTLDDWYHGTAIGTGPQTIEGPAVASPGAKAIFVRATQSDGGEAWSTANFSQDRLTRAGAAIDRAGALRETYQINSSLADTRRGASIYAGPGGFKTAIPLGLPAALGQTENGAHWVLRARVTYRTQPPDIGLEAFEGWFVGLARSLNPRSWNEPGEEDMVKVWDDPFYIYADMIEVAASLGAQGAVSVAFWYRPANYERGQPAVHAIHFKRAASLLGPWPDDDAVFEANNPDACVIASSDDLPVAIPFGPYHIRETATGQLWVWGQGYYRSKDGGRTWLGHGSNPFFDD